MKVKLDEKENERIEKLLKELLSRELWSNYYSTYGTNSYSSDAKKTYAFELFVKKLSPENQEMIDVSDVKKFKASMEKAIIYWFDKGYVPSNKKMAYQISLTDKEGIFLKIVESGYDVNTKKNGKDNELSIGSRAILKGFAFDYVLNHQDFNIEKETAPVVARVLNSLMEKKSNSKLYKMIDVLPSLLEKIAVDFYDEDGYIKKEYQSFSNKLPQMLEYVENELVNPTATDLKKREIELVFLEAAVKHELVINERKKSLGFFRRDIEKYNAMIREKAIKYDEAQMYKEVENSLLDVEANKPMRKGLKF